jgi:signal transduction histidine kinase
MRLVNYLRRSQHRIAAQAVILLLLSVGMLFGLAPSALATNYGQNPYGTCAYQQDCAPSTIIALPPSPSTPTASPLEVNINLKDEQVIPRSGYKIVVTPLNGSGTTFAKVDFYIDGTHAQLQTPDEEGTVSWFWNVSQFPGTTVRVLVTGQDGQTVSQTFHLKLAPLGQSSGTAATAQPKPSILQQIARAPAHLVQNATRSISKLPKPVKYSLPYFLFLILAGDIILLLIRTRHEVQEAKRLQALLDRERQNAEIKHTFMELISHYLRTPLTVIKGGLEIAEKSSSTPAAVKAALNHAGLLNGAINDLLTQLSHKNAPAPVVAEPVVAEPSFWRNPSFFVPISLIGLVALCFDYLAQHDTTFDLGQINLIIQIVLFGSLSVLVQQSLRYGRLKQRERLATDHILTLENTFHEERDEVVSYGATQVKDLTDDIAADIIQIQPAEAGELASRGSTRLKEVVVKLLVADQLKGSRSNGAYISVTLDDIVQQALGDLESQVAAKKIRLHTLKNTSLQTQSPELLQFVLHTILDNAVAYSSVQGEVAIDATLAHGNAMITITDHGSGIPSEKQFLLFEAFSKTEGAETFNHEGMGFSLYLDKLIMHYFVGDITIESEPKQGTKVTLTLPQPLPMQ